MHHPCGQRARHGQAIQPRHRHVEQHQIGTKRIDQPQRLRAVAGSAHHLEGRYPCAEDLHPFDRKGFVINDQRAHQQSFQTTGSVSTVA